MSGVKHLHNFLYPGFFLTAANPTLSANSLNYRLKWILDNLHDFIMGYWFQVKSPHVSFHPDAKLIVAWNAWLNNLSHMPVLQTGPDVVGTFTRRVWLPVKGRPILVKLRG
jgi:hypothetical protein